MSSQKSKKPIFVTLAVLLLLGCAAVGFLLFTPSQPEVKFASETERAQVAQSVETRVNTFRQSVQNRQPTAPLQLQEREVNAIVRSPENLQKLAAKGVTNPSVKLGNGEVVVGGEVTVNGVKLPVSVTGTPAGASGFQVTAVKVGKMPAPQQITAEVAAKVEAAVRDGSLQLPPGVSGVKVEDGKLIVTGSY